jgi:hypothetical protein
MGIRPKIRMIVIESLTGTFDILMTFPITFSPKKMDIYCLNENLEILLSTRRAKILTGGIHGVF